MRESDHGSTDSPVEDGTQGVFRLACRACGHAYPGDGLPPVCPECGGFWRARPRECLSAWRPAGHAGGLTAHATLFGLTPGELPERPLGSLPRRLGDAVLLPQGSAPRPGRRAADGSVTPRGGSYKERGAEVLAAICRRRGLDEVFLDSSGNAGIAVASACATRGIRCRVLVPRTTPETKRRAIEAAGGLLEVVDGDRTETYRRAQALRRELPYASHIVQPFFLLGVASLVWEAWADLDGALPPRWLVPVGHGALLLGIALGIDTLEAAGLLKRRPELWPVQLAGYAALAAPEERGRRDEPPRAAGIAIELPPRLADLHSVLGRHGGPLTVVTEDEVAAARRALAAENLGTDPTGAAAWAARLRHDAPQGDTQTETQATAEADTQADTRATTGAPLWAVILSSREPAP